MLCYVMQVDPRFKLLVILPKAALICFCYMRIGILMPLLRTLILIIIDNGISLKNECRMRAQFLRSIVMQAQAHRHQPGGPEAQPQDQPLSRGQEQLLHQGQELGQEVRGASGPAEEWETAWCKPGNAGDWLTKGEDLGPEQQQVEYLHDACHEAAGKMPGRRMLVQRLIKPKLDHTGSRFPWMHPQPGFLEDEHTSCSEMTSASGSDVSDLIHIYADLVKSASKDACCSDAEDSSSWSAGAQPMKGQGAATSKLRPQHPVLQHTSQTTTKTFTSYSSPLHRVLVRGNFNHIQNLTCPEQCRFCRHYMSTGSIKCI